jgi:predicted ferric reductase/Ca2+-binding EF-hand superfamily protein
MAAPLIELIRMRPRAVRLLARDVRHGIEVASRCVQQPARPSSVDRALIEVIERSFARLAAKGGVIDVKTLQDALGLRSEYLARRVLAGFDLNRDGVIAKDEFIAGVRALIAGTDQEKLSFAFRVHDHDGDGALSRDELLRMIAISLSESDVTERVTQPAERLAQSLFAAADKNADGRLSFAEFEAVVRKYPALLRAMTRSEAQWIAPNEDIVARVEGGAPGGSLSLFSSPRENGLGPVLVLCAWIATNVGILAFGLARGRGGPPVNELMQAGRALAKCIDFNGALLLVPVMRRWLTWVRSTFVGRALPIDQAVTFHRVVGHTLVALGLAHGGALIASYVIGHPTGSVDGFVFRTERGLTGVALLVVIEIMWVFALSIIRRTARFELFYFSHLLYVVWFVLAIAHSPSFLLWAGVPLLGFAVEQIFRLARRGRKTTVVEAHALRSGVTRIELRTPPGFTWRPGDYAFLRIPAVAEHEWHPFTISSASESGKLTFHIRSLGNWTAALRRGVEGDEQRGARPELVAYVDGPYGSPSAHIFDSRFAVFIGAGIGVTPFASVLESLLLRARSERPPRLAKAHFFWLNKDQYSFEWFAALLADLEKNDLTALLDIHLCMTAGRGGAMALGLELARQVGHAAGHSDIITGLRTHTHMGPPDWEQMLGAIRAQHAPERVDVYFCGPPGLAAKIRPVCARLGMSFREEKF